MEELNIAIIENNVERIQQLLPDLALSQENLYWVLWSYININCFKTILQYVDVNFKSGSGQAHLLHAASFNNIELVRLLLEQGIPMLYHVTAYVEKDIFSLAWYLNSSSTISHLSLLKPYHKYVIQHIY